MAERIPSETEDVAIRRSYVRVLIIWVITLAGLYLLQAWFS